jgi:hypothetical protein
LAKRQPLHSAGFETMVISAAPIQTMHVAGQRWTPGKRTVVRYANANASPDGVACGKRNEAGPR